RNHYFEDPDGTATGGDLADPDHDGWVNVLEYAFSTDPTIPTPTEDLPQTGLNGTRLEVQYTPCRADIEYRVEISSNLSDWTTEGIEETANGEVVIAFPSDPSLSPVFLRLAVSNGDAFVPLFSANTVLEPPLQLETDEALYTYFSDRARDRHAREDQYQAYDHYLTHYWEHRTVAVEIIDTIPKGGDTITFVVESQWKLKEAQAELRFFYRGIGTVAEYYDNKSMTPLDDTHYIRTVSFNAKEGRPIQVGDRMEFELSQFLESPPVGRDNYYGTTYLYIVGEGLVPWETRGVFGDASTEREDSYPIPERARLGGGTTLPYEYSNEPDNHFMQMATNLSSINGQTFVLGRRVHHTDFGDGSHDEGTGNPDFEELSGFLGLRYVNNSCVACHTRNGRAIPPPEGEILSDYVVRVGDGTGNSHPLLGSLLQSRSTDGEPEAVVRLAAWQDVGDLRQPLYRFEDVTPAHFSVRIAPQLVGMGLLEAIPETDIAALADPDDANGDGISGRLRIVTDPESGDQRIGRFGWKASEPTVRSQVASALNADMGVLTTVFPHPDLGSQQTDAEVHSPELEETHLKNLTAYISLLGVRPQRNIEDPKVIRGKELFGTLQCASCHIPEFQTSPFHPHAELRDQTIRPYTDLLLHDMGPGLADSLNQT
ncbi:MAG: di-heme oxidoredictase family protein, partial [Verrucomicrobiota bacterium]